MKNVFIHYTVQRQIPSLSHNSQHKGRIRPREKESTEIRITQNKGKETENSLLTIEEITVDRHTKTHGNKIEIF